MSAWRCTCGQRAGQKLAEIAAEHRHLLTADPEVEQNPEQYYDRVVEIDLSTLEPHVTGPHSPDRARTISELAAEVEREGFPDRVSVALVGSCTNSSYEDMERCADVARQAAARGVTAASGLLVTPGSEQVRATIERDGQAAALEAVGATVLANACGPCIGQWNRPEARGTEKQHRYLLQPQLPQPQRRQCRHHELYRQPGACGSHGPGRSAVVQPADRPAD